MEQSSLKALQIPRAHKPASLRTKNEDVAHDRFQIWLKEEFPNLTSQEKSLSDLLTFWLSQTDTSDSHQNKVKAHWNEFKDYFDNVPATEITRDAINEYFIYWKTERTIKGGKIASETYRSNWHPKYSLRSNVGLDSQNRYSHIGYSVSASQVYHRLVYVVISIPLPISLYLYLD